MLKEHRIKRGVVIINKIKISCKCGCSFSIELTNIVNKSEIVYPNCSSSLDESLLTQLKSMAVALIEINKNNIGEFSKYGDSTPPNFTISIE